VRKARRQRPVGRDGDLAEETKVVRQHRGVLEAGKHQVVDPFLLKFDVIPKGSMRLHEMLLLDEYWILSMHDGHRRLGDWSSEILTLPSAVHDRCRSQSINKRPPQMTHSLDCRCAI
jgi:hypothetical protein